VRISLVTSAVHRASPRWQILRQQIFERIFLSIKIMFIDDLKLLNKIIHSEAQCIAHKERLNVLSVLIVGNILIILLICVTNLVVCFFAILRINKIFFKDLEKINFLINLM